MTSSSCFSSREWYISDGSTYGCCNIASKQGSCYESIVIFLMNVFMCCCPCLYMEREIPL